MSSKINAPSKRPHLLTRLFGRKHHSSDKTTVFGEVATPTTTPDRLHAATAQYGIAAREERMLPRSTTPYVSDVAPPARSYAPFVSNGGAFAIPSPPLRSDLPPAEQPIAASSESKVEQPLEHPDDFASTEKVVSSDDGQYMAKYSDYVVAIALSAKRPIVDGTTVQALYEALEVNTELRRAAGLWEERTTGRVEEWNGLLLARRRIRWVLKTKAQTNTALLENFGFSLGLKNGERMVKPPFAFRPRTVRDINDTRSLEEILASAWKFVVIGNDMELALQESDAAWHRSSDLSSQELASWWEKDADLRVARSKTLLDSDRVDLNLPPIPTDLAIEAAEIEARRKPVELLPALVVMTAGGQVCQLTEIVLGKPLETGTGKAIHNSLNQFLTKVVAALPGAVECPSLLSEDGQPITAFLVPDKFELKEAVAFRLGSIWGSKHSQLFERTSLRDANHPAFNEKREQETDALRSIFDDRTVLALVGSRDQRLTQDTDASMARRSPARVLESASASLGAF